MQTTKEQAQSEQIHIESEKIKEILSNHIADSNGKKGTEILQHILQRAKTDILKIEIKNYNQITFQPLTNPAGKVYQYRDKKGEQGNIHVSIALSSDILSKLPYFNTAIEKVDKKEFSKHVQLIKSLRALTAGSTFKKNPKLQTKDGDKTPKLQTKDGYKIVELRPKLNHNTNDFYGDIRLVGYKYEDNYFFTEIGLHDHINENMLKVATSLIAKENLALHSLYRNQRTLENKLKVKDKEESISKLLEAIKKLEESYTETIKKMEIEKNKSEYLKHTRMKTEINHDEGNIKSLNTQLKADQQQLEKLQKSLIVDQQQLEKLQKSLIVDQQQLKELENSLPVKQSTLESYKNAALIKIQETVKALGEQITQIRTQHTNLEVAYNQATDELNMLQSSEEKVIYKATGYSPESLIKISNKNNLEAFSQKVQMADGSTKTYKSPGSSENKSASPQGSTKASTDKSPGSLDIENNQGRASVSSFTDSIKDFEESKANYSLTQLNKKYNQFEGNLSSAIWSEKTLKRTNSGEFVSPKKQQQQQDILAQRQEQPKLYITEALKGQDGKLMKVSLQNRS